MKQSQISVALGVATLLAGAGSAKGDFFSFASDRNGGSPTFRSGATSPGSLGGFTDAGSLSPNGRVNTDLLWDQDEDGPGQAVVIPAYFTLEAQLNSASVTPFAGGFIEAYSASGAYVFRDPASNAAILTVSFTNAAFVSFSDSSQLLGTSATLQGSAATDAGLTFTGSGPLAGRLLNGPRTFAFTLTNLRGLQGGRATLGQGSAFSNLWISEGSWSANAIPAPGAMALAGIGALLTVRRRRSGV